ncbi:MAG: PAS domain S-box protein [Gammaproteobacteria bacterium]|nr:PAS domain S-box protein [Gammaproteobacteria bacterium]
MKTGLSNLFKGESPNGTKMPGGQKYQELISKIDAIHRVNAVIEFELDGTIITANDNFLHCMGYELSEIQGKHHSMFVTESEKRSDAYVKHWEKLRAGEFIETDFQRLAKDGSEIWIHASYNAILDEAGKPYKVIKFASDITEHKLRRSDYRGQIEAINKSQAVIEFSLDGIILDANQNFLDAVGYRLEEVKGKHHRIFVPEQIAQGAEYQKFWDNLSKGQHEAGEFHRVGKQGNDIWIQASYNPILDLNGKPFKVVKYASDITAQHELRNTVETVLKNTSTAIKALSEGDLTQRMEGEYEGDFAQLQQDVNNCFHKLNHTLSEIRVLADDVKTDSANIAGGNENLSQRTQQQAASVEETAASLEEMTTAVSQNANNTKQANQIVLSAADKAKEGGETVSSAIEAMRELDESSKKITNIIGVIDEIAFQTNLLALNAAVEAARAGEQGRGFAVVASEVRGLAGRSSDAAKEIKDLIKDSEKRVEQSSLLVNKSGTVLEEIVDIVTEVKELVSNIASAGVEQSEGIEGVNQSLTQIDEITQDNSSLVDQATTASSNLNERAQRLNALVAAFKVHTGDHQYDSGVDSIEELPKVANG